jgi:hypothetical protein
MALQKIAEIKIDGEDYELAANGQAYLVVKTDEDAYGKPVPRTVDLEEWIIGTSGFIDGTAPKLIINKIQDLLNRIVALERSLQSSRDTRLKVGQDIGKEVI